MFHFLWCKVCHVKFASLLQNQIRFWFCCSPSVSPAFFFGVFCAFFLVFFGDFNFSFFLRNTSILILFQI
uniref:Putative ovule protein n=1 Tax=Solanum chacoense TaxID=4108 RepID=A0A0V0H3M8_SOLCH